MPERALAGPMLPPHPADFLDAALAERHHALARAFRLDLERGLTTNDSRSAAQGVSETLSWNAILRIGWGIDYVYGAEVAAPWYRAAIARLLDSSEAGIADAGPQDARRRRAEVEAFIDDRLVAMEEEAQLQVRNGLRSVTRPLHRVDWQTLETAYRILREVEEDPFLIRRAAVMEQEVIFYSGQPRLGPRDRLAEIAAGAYGQMPAAEEGDVRFIVDRLCYLTDDHAAAEAHLRFASAQDGNHYTHDARALLIRTLCALLRVEEAVRLREEWAASFSAAALRRIDAAIAAASQHLADGTHWALEGWRY